MPKLSDTKIRAAKPRGKPYELFDADGLFLSVQPNGGRWWRQRYYPDDDVMACLRRSEDRNLLDTAHRALSENDSLFRYGKKRKYVKHNIVADLRGPDTLPRAKVKHHAAITDPAQPAPLLRAIDAYHGGFVVLCALRLLPLVFVRPGVDRPDVFLRC